MSCGVCGGARFAPFFQACEWSRSGVYLSDAVYSAPPEPLTIRTEYCLGCGLVRQVPGFELLTDYAGTVRDTAGQLPDYAAHIIVSLAEYGVGFGDLVVEVGANDGTFIQAIRAAGYRNLIGIEPSKRLARVASRGGVDIRNEYFGASLAHEIVREHGGARAVLCRHTLEHALDVRDMAQGIAHLLVPGGLAFIEVPDTDWDITGLFAHEIWDEHISYFRAGSLTTLISSVGLLPRRLECAGFRAGRNLLCWATRDVPPRAPRQDFTVYATGWTELAGFQALWDAFAARLRARVAMAARPVIALGASHIQLNLLNFAGLDVDLLVDDDPEKAGRYAPLASPVPICTTAEALRSVRDGTLLDTAFAYPAWQERLSKALDIHGVGLIRPYDLR